MQKRGVGQYSAPTQNTTVSSGEASAAVEGALCAISRFDSGADWATAAAQPARLDSTTRIRTARGRGRHAGVRSRLKIHSPRVVSWRGPRRCARVWWL